MDKQSAHTPGPWKVEESLDCSPAEGSPEHGIPDLLIFGSDGTQPAGARPHICRNIANVDRIYNHSTRDLAMEQANARLIAAAPNLLAALCCALNDYGTAADWPSHHIEPEWVGQARAAIAKVEVQNG